MSRDVAAASPAPPVRNRLLALVLRPTAPPLTTGVVVAVVLILAEIAVVHVLKQVAPENAFGAVFLLGVLVVSASWGFGLALATSLASTLAYVGFHVSEGSGSLAPAVVVFLTLALLANVLVGQARLRALEADQRRREADLSAELARIMLRSVDLPAALDAASTRMAEVLELPYATLTLEVGQADDGHQTITLHDGSTPVGSLLVPATLPAGGTQRVRRLVPSLEALLSAARERAQITAAVSALAEQQAALRRVATLVARGANPADIYPVAVTELARGLNAEHASLVRFASDTEAVVVAGTAAEPLNPFAPGERVSLTGDNVAIRIQATGRPARIDDYSAATGEWAARVHQLGLTSGVGAPVTVDGRTWGAMIVCSTKPTLPPETEDKVTDFADLVSTAIFNSETRAELQASRARIVAAADQARRGFERDLHDGAQQRIVSLGLELGAISAAAGAESPELAGQLGAVVEGLSGLYADLQELSRGIHPAILSRGGLGPAIKTLARRSPVPVDLSLDIAAQIPDSVQVAAYYVVAEALTNTAKYAGAEQVSVLATARDGHLHLAIADDGVGGAQAGGGSGLIGLTDRVNALSGDLTVSSPQGGGTTLCATIPLTPEH
nr:GAF domain-containing sensor histidine kinase [Mycolicibacterium mengxianglii]